MRTWIFGGLLFTAGLAACSNKVLITAETTGSATGTGGSSTATSGTGASGPGGTTSSSGAGGSTGTGGTGKLVTADTDIAQYVSTSTTGTAQNPVETKVIEGPFFVTDVIGLTYVLSTVQGSDCSVSTDKHTVVVLSTTANGGQLHGVRIPILAGQSLCTQAGLNYNVTVLGFRPY